MEFVLLGDVEVRVDGHVVDVGHSRQRCVLAALLVDANRLVPVDVLVDRVWGDRVPHRARNAVAGYVSRLRQVLPDVRITGRQGGYVLAVDPMSVDLHRFDALVARARQQPDQAVVLLTEALGLWRGEPFSTVDTPWLATVRSGLEARRTAALLDRNDLVLEQGRHTELLAELEVMAAAFPLDERLAGQLMLALYRCGRQADALLRYEQVRMRLAEELGTDPGPALRLLHKQMLTADHALTISSPAARPVPRQLPAPPRAFAGRGRELAALDVIMNGRHPIVVSGTAGVGKTALAVHWAHRVAGRFPDGQLYVNLRGFDPSGAVMAPGEAVRAFLDALGVDPQRIPASLDAQTALFRSALADKRVLVVLDNARDADQVRPLLPGSPGCVVLVTSRNRLAGLVATHGAHPLALDLLSTVEARVLLADRLGEDRLRAEPDAADEIITRCSGLPIALTIVAARVDCTSFSLQAIAAELRGGLDPFDGGDSATDVRAVFSWSYHALEPAAARLFRLLGPHPGPDVSAAAAASLFGAPVRPVLAELTRAHLLTEHQPGRYVFHDLLRAYATEQAQHHDSDAERRAATTRLHDHYVHTAHTATRLLSPAREVITPPTPQPGVHPESLGDFDQALAWFTAEHHVLLAAVDHAAATGLDPHAGHLAWALAEFLERRGHWLDLAAVGHVALAAALRLADPLAQSHAHRFLARASTQLDRLDDAHLHHRRSLDVAGDPVGQARSHRELAYVCERQGRHDQALDHSRQAMELYEAAGHRRGQAGALNAVGWYQALLGDLGQALTSCQAALELLEELDDPDGEASTWDSLGYIHHHRGDHREAIACYRRSLDVFRSLGDRYWTADVLVHLGDSHLAAGDPGSAGAAWQEALGILEDLGHPHADAVRARISPMETHSVRR
ncbi:AfsR/SARP family transcriptional regulator [Lentzea nigeriaca]|uniref:AfsR/SARP family transcriptional regulator n=1 Tax=Lentzea nigeriaca TaxID=1128665 RepID=UPI001956720A|nr:BTAD domain-containing putative transcriptional regulator [Lentzea nigeriaca]MBM7860997.1 DNA-binding SARP family transcriptional activator/tetratricopeptide (TPR) repeat protein [Lentzea nigeriaca]